MPEQFHRKLIELLEERAAGHQYNALCQVPVSLANSIPLLVLGKLDVEGYFNEHKN